MNWNVHVHVAYRSIHVLILAGQYIGLCWLHIALPLPVTDHWYWHITPYTEIHKTSVGFNIHSTDSLLIQIWTYDCWNCWWILQIVTSVISWDVSEYSVGPSDNMSANRWAAVILHKKSSLHCVNTTFPCTNLAGAFSWHLFFVWHCWRHSWCTFDLSPIDALASLVIAATNGSTLLSWHNIFNPTRPCIRSMSI